MDAVLRLGRLVPDTSAQVLMKLEHLGLTGSHKDRVARHLVADLAPGRTVVEASTGNLAIALASECALRGLGFVAVVPPACTAEQRMMIALLGAEIVSEPSLESAAARARTIARERGAFHPDQFGARGALERIYAESVGRELAAIAPDVFVCGAGTGALLAGVARALGGTRIVQVVPDGPIPGLTSSPVSPEQVTVSAAQAAATARRLARDEGLLVGPSTGANVAAALAIAARLPPTRRVVTLACDTGERYFSLEMEARA